MRQPHHYVERRLSSLIAFTSTTFHMISCVIGIGKTLLWHSPFVEVTCASVLLHRPNFRILYPSNGSNSNIRMLFIWLFLITLLGSPINAVSCNAHLGTLIQPQDCLFAKAILYTKLLLSHPGNVNFMDTQQTFTTDVIGDYRYRLPNGASFGSCGLGVDLAPSRQTIASWTQFFAQVDTLIHGCPGSHLAPGRGGIHIIGHLNLVVVNPGQGMCYLAGTCMAPNPARNRPLSLIVEMAARYRGFQRVAASRLLQPVTTILPAPPVLFHLGSALTSPIWPQYRVAGQWVCNTDVWSPMILGNALLTAHIRPVFVLLTAGRVTAAQPNPFSRNFPRSMGAAWFHVQNQIPIQVRGAWGARGSIWHPLTGDLTNIQLLVRTYEWVLVELGDTDQAGPSTSPNLRQNLGVATASQRQAAILQGTQRAAAAMEAQRAAQGEAGPSRGPDDSGNLSEATIPNDPDDSYPDDLLADLGYGSQNQGQASGSMGTQTLAMGSPVTRFPSLSTGLYLPFGNALNTSTATNPSASTSAPPYFAAQGASGTQGNDAVRPFKRPRPNP